MAVGVVDALSDRIERRAQVRSGPAAADLTLLSSFAYASVGGQGAYGNGGYGNRFGEAGRRQQDPAGMMPERSSGTGMDPRMMQMPMHTGPMDRNTAVLPAGSLYVPGGKDGRWTGWARTSVGHFSSYGSALPLYGQMQMGIFGADYEIGRVLAGVAVAHGRGQGAMTPAGLDRAYSASSTMTSVNPYVAFDLAEDLTIWGQTGYGRGKMGLIETLTGGDQAGMYRTCSRLAMVAAGVRGGLPEVAGFQLSLSMAPSLGSASQGAGRLWGMQDMNGLAPYGVPFDMGPQYAAELGYRMVGPGGRDTGTPYTGVTQSGMGYRAMRYGWRWEVQSFNFSVEGARQAGFGGFAQPVLSDAGNRLGGAHHSVQVRGGVSF